MASRRRTHVRGVALLALLAFLGVFAAAFVHTDDGCAVEIHCLACRHAVGTTAVSPPAPLPLAAELVDLGAVPQPPGAFAPRFAPRTDATRGPPLV